MKYLAIILCIGFFMLCLLSGCKNTEISTTGEPCTGNADCLEGQFCIGGVCVDSDGSSDGDMESAAEEEAEPDQETDGDIEPDSEDAEETETDQEIDGDIEPDQDNETDTESDADSESDVETDQEVDGDTEPDQETDSEDDTEAPEELESDEECECSADDPCCSDGCHIDEDGTVCNDDNDACNGVNTCQQGACMRTTEPVICAALDECHVAGICNTATGECSNPVGNEGSVCNDDNDACNGVSTCIEGTCTETTQPVTCTAMDACHLAGICDPVSGECSNPTGNEGSVCNDDNDACNGISTCVEGTCVETTQPVTCTATDECHVAGVCDPVSGECSNPTGNEGSVCNDDNDACNGISTCVAGACVETTDPVICTALDECHVAGVCDTATGQCSNPAGNEGAFCNEDDNACDGISTCVEGACTETTGPVTCTATDNCHVPGICNPATGECSNPAGNDGAVCNDDNDACNGISTCLEGTCIQTTEPVTCTATDECHVAGTCNPDTGLCTNPAGNEGGLCNDDENVCNGIHTCVQGTCQRTTEPVVCTALDECHVAGICDPLTGQCSNPVGNEGLFCNDDNDMCNGVYTCVGGVCAETTAPVACTALDDCHTPGTCDPATGQCSNPVGNDGAICNHDNNLCNGISTCSDGSCIQTTAPVVCTAQDECHIAGICDPATGQCSNPAGNEGGLCNDDNNACNGVNTCVQGICLRTTDPVVCMAQDECHNAGTCDPNTGQCSNPAGNDGAVCNNDNDVCNGISTCDGGACVQTTPPVICTALDDCHVPGACNTATGECSNPVGNEGGVCNDDGDACNGVNTCHQGTCLRTTNPVVCTAQDECHIAGTCDPSTGLCSNPPGNNGAVCNDDNDICNGMSTCVDGMCALTTPPVTCTALDDCHTPGTCDPVTGQCSNPVGNDGEACNEDNNPCNGTYSCTNGACTQSNPPVVCTAGECHGAGTCNPFTGRCSNPPINEGGLCNDDNDMCNGVSTCIDGSCLETMEPVVCTAMDDCHLAGTCDPVNGECSNPIGNEGGICNDDGLACNGTNICQNGVCVEGPPQENTCIINSACYEAGQESPGNQCYVCDPEANTTDWTLRGNNDGWCTIIEGSDVTCFESTEGFCPPEIFNAANANCILGTCEQCGQLVHNGCHPGNADCDNNILNGCETILGTLLNCGSCGDECVPGGGTQGTCTNYQCEPGVCAVDYADCDADAGNGCESYLPGDDRNCGACDYNCTTLISGGACSDGLCYNLYANFPVSRGDCDHNDTNGLEANLENDAFNCGECGYVCPAGGICKNGYCYTADETRGDCDRVAANGMEYILDPSDPNNCGACNYVCPSGAVCSNGLCHNGTSYDCDRNYWLAGSQQVTLETNISADTTCGSCEVLVNCTTLNPPLLCNDDGCGSFQCGPPLGPLPPEDTRAVADSQPKDPCDALVGLLSGDPDDPGFLGTFAASDDARNETYKETVIAWGVLKALSTDDAEQCRIMEPLGYDAVAECRSMHNIYSLLVTLQTVEPSDKYKEALRQYATSTISGMVWDILFEVKPGVRSCSDIYDPQGEAFGICSAVMENDPDRCDQLSGRKRIRGCRALVEILNNLNNPRWDSFTAFDSQYFLPRYITDFAKGSIDNCDALLTDRLHEQCQTEEQ